MILIKASNNDLLHDKKFIITFISKERLIISDVIDNNLFKEIKPRELQKHFICFMKRPRMLRKLF